LAEAILDDTWAFGAHGAGDLIEVQIDELGDAQFRRVL
jgi:hypothetical protein